MSSAKHKQKAEEAPPQPKIMKKKNSEADFRRIWLVESAAAAGISLLAVILASIM